ncbi:MAG: hypothetical protein COX80_03575 [Candidatus Magasanikbacteria bacterium CG_4_10_14_0_2_um_filter_33_14]|uniref:Uncharacterized protein n=1 Tax=Candidatus Magasanikbacteria bacterium CG_4_10_14_0_2_um_filter_33_14 TaxID=1974636 RepID=A0A2M7VA75_9BACT|nr:MAG: hypothetical protein COX80_03575 [Candidatus Magasanikbacteria bacterium CG_4_10_14_0_2_um_filter_33_14]
MKFGIYKIFGILVFVFVISFFKIDLVFSESKYCKCTSDKGVCEEGAKLKSDCDKMVQDSNGQFTQCVMTTTDKNCSALATSRKFCACAADKSDCGPTIYADLPECDRNKGAVNASYQCIQVENGKGCSSLVDATQNGDQSGSSQGGSASSFLGDLDPQIKGLNKLQGVDNLQQLIGRAISALLGILGSIALVMMLFGGFTWMTSAGNVEKRKKATGIIIWSVLGVSIIFASYAMVNFVLDIFK